MNDWTCSCHGCWACKGHVVGCTCDVDWDAITEDRLAANTPDLFDTERVQCPQCGAFLAAAFRSTWPAALSMQIVCDCGLTLEVTNDAYISPPPAGSAA